MLELITETDDAREGRPSLVVPWLGLRLRLRLSRRRLRSNDLRCCHLHCWPPLLSQLGRRCHPSHHALPSFDIGDGALCSCQLYGFLWKLRLGGGAAGCNPVERFEKRGGKSGVERVVRAVARLNCR